MTPIIANGLNGWVIYMRPGLAAQRKQMSTTHGTQFDPIERTNMTGSIPEPMTRVDVFFATKKEALAAIAA